VADLPLVSVIIPTRDRPDLVVGALRSALGQEDVRVEVCVVDDGSRVPLTLPPELSGDGRVALIRLDRARGVAAARNVGVGATSALLIAFLDDDDAWLPGKLARQVAALREAGPGTAMIACGFELWEGRRLVATVLPPPGLNSGALLAHPCIWPSTVLARRAAIEAAGGFDESLARVDDWDLSLRIADRGEIGSVLEVLVDRRWQPVPLVEAHAWRAAIAPRLDARLALLPRPQARRLRARRLCDDASLLTRLGRRRDARTALLVAWRTDPRSRAAVLGLLRLLAGERAWLAAARVAAPFRARRRLRRRPPRPPGPAPVWAGQ
jgi:glycosyltransferase involved in cell wall biosynthesis